MYRSVVVCTVLLAVLLPSVAVSLPGSVVAGPVTPIASVRDQGADDSGDNDSDPVGRFLGSIWTWITGGDNGNGNVDGNADESPGSPGDMTSGSCHPAAMARPGVVRATDFGARPNDGADDGPAIQCALDSMVAGQTLVFDPGEYSHGKVLRAGVADVRVTGRGATLVATDERAEAFKIDADRVAVDTLTFGVVPTSKRIPGRQRSKIWIAGHDGVALTDVTVTGAAAGGVIVSDGASNFRLVRVTVRGTRADGIHMTDGATGGLVDHPSISQNGDDGVAVVSYKKDPAPVRNITVNSPHVFDQNRGRGLSVVGGENIRYNDVHVEASPSAAVYIAVEGDPWNTRDVSNVVVRGGDLVASNTKQDVDHGAVLVFLGTPQAQIGQVSVEDLTIDATRPSASSSVSVKSADGQQPRSLQFDRLRIVGGPGKPYGGNVPASAYSIAN